MKKAVKTVSFIIFATLLAKIMGMLRDVFIANSYGTSIEASAYMSASQIPVSFFDLALGVAVLSTFIPVFNGFLQSKGKERAFAFANSFITLMFLISTVFCILGIVFSKQFAEFIATGMDNQAKLLTSKLLVIMFPTMIFTTLAFCFVGVLQSLDEFNIPAIISLVSNVAVIIYLLFFNDKFGLYGLAFAMVLGWILQALVQVPSLIKKGYIFKPSFDFKDEGIKQVFILALPILVSSWVQPISVLVNKKYASYINGGLAVSGLDYANRLYIIIVGVFAFGITNYIFPSLSRMCESGDKEGFAAVMKQSMRIMLLIIAPVMAGMMLLSPHIISLIYERGEFNAESVKMTSTALFYYSIGMIPYGINEISNKCFYAMKNGKSPMIASIFGIVTTCTLSCLFVRVFGFGIGALALSAAISAIIVSVILLFIMNKKVYKIFDKKIFVFIIKIIISTLIMALIAYGVRNITSRFGTFVNIIFTGTTGFVVYLIMIFIMRVEELREVLPKISFKRGEGD